MKEDKPMMENKKKHVGLFVTCLADLFRPAVAIATAQILQKAGYRVSAPKTQTCCGQPAYNNGNRELAKKIAIQNIEIFQKYDFIVVPSGSCAAMIKIHFKKLVKNNPKYLEKAQKLAQKTSEITQFINNHIDPETQKKIFQDVTYPKNVTYHDACAGLRELKIKQQPRNLLKKINGITLTEMNEAEICCGFGGTFCVKYPHISNHMLKQKIDNIKKTNAHTILAGDLGCLFNIAGKIKRKNETIEVRHIVEILAGEIQNPPIAEPDQKQNQHHAQSKAK